MTDHELLLAMSNLFDKKLKPMEERLDKLEERLDKLEEHMCKLEGRMGKLEERMCKLEERLDILEGRVDKLETGMAYVQKELAVLKEQMSRMESRIADIRNTQENNILPRLQNIEECYLSTYKRYTVHADKMEGMQLDIDILKQVTTEHSIKLQFIS